PARSSLARSWVHLTGVALLRQVATHEVVRLARGMLRAVLPAKRVDVGVWPVDRCPVSGADDHDLRAVEHSLTVPATLQDCTPLGEITQPTPGELVGVVPRP